MTTSTPNSVKADIAPCVNDDNAFAHTDYYN